MAKATKAKTAEPRCDDCRYYVKSDETQGFCRRNPPQVPSLNMSQFPSVKAEWFCGEFVGK